MSNTTQPNVLSALGGSISFGQNAKPNAWIPYLLAFVAIVMVSSVTGIFKKKGRR